MTDTTETPTSPASTTTEHGRIPWWWISFVVVGGLIIAFVELSESSDSVGSTLTRISFKLAIGIVPIIFYLAISRIQKNRRAEVS